MIDNTNYNLASIKKKKKEKIGLFLGPILFVITILIPTPQSMADAAESNSTFNLAPQIAIGSVLWILTWWISECVALGLAALLAPFIFVISGILSIDQSLSTFSDPIIWIFASGFILAAAFHKYDLDKRVAYSLAMLYKGNNPKIAIFFVACIPVFLLTIAGSITASTAIVFPFVVAFMGILGIHVGNENHNFKNNDNGGDNTKKNAGDTTTTKNISNDSKENKYAEASFLVLGQAATSGAMLLLISTPPNLIAKSTVETFVPSESITFADWFVIGTPHAIMGLLISWVVVFLLINPNIRRLPTTHKQFKSSLHSIGKMKREEKIVLAVLVLALFLWIIPSMFSSIDSHYDDNSKGSNNNDSIASKNSKYGVFSGFIEFLKNNVTEAVPPLIIILSMGLIPTRGRNKNNVPLLSLGEMTKAIDWNVIILFGGGLTLGLGIESSGLADWISFIISSSLGGESTPWSVFALSAIMGFSISYVASNTASAVITCPLAATLAIGVGLNPIPPIIAAGLASSISSGLPSTTPPMAMVYSSKVVRISNMFKTGIVSDLIRLSLLIVIGPILIDVVF